MHLSEVVEVTPLEELPVHSSPATSQTPTPGLCGPSPSISAISGATSQPGWPLGLRGAQ